MNDIWCPVARIYDPLKAGSIDGTDTEPHDRGIVRALQAEYRPNDLVVGDPKLTIFTARLNPETTEERIEKFFSHYGKIRRIRLVRDVVTGFSKKYAFIEFKDKQGALEAYRQAHRTELDGNIIFVDFECSRNLRGWIPRRLGGGFGGKKESGQLRFGGRDRLFKKPIALNQTHDFRQENYLNRNQTRSNNRHYERNERNQNRSHNQTYERNERNQNRLHNQTYERNERNQNRSHNQTDERNERKRKHRKHHRSRSRSRSRDNSRKRHKHR